MYTISDLYTEYLNKRHREWMIKVDIDGVEYGSSVIVDFEIDNSLEMDDFQLGTAIVSQLKLRLKTSDVIAPNARVIPYLGLLLPESLDGANVAWQDATDTWDAAVYPWQGARTEWLPLGEFYIDTRQQQNNVWTFKCLDKLIWAEVPYVSALAYPATMQAVWDEICTALGYTYDGTVVIDPTYTLPVAPTGFTDREVLGYIAAANAASVYVSKDGIIRFRKFSVTDEPVFEMTDADYIRAKQTNPEKTFTRIVVTYDTEQQLTYEAGTGDDNHTLYLENPLVTQSMVDDLHAALNGYRYIPVEIDARGYPQIEVGDRLRFGAAAEAVTWDEAATAWDATAYSWDGFYDGGYTIAQRIVYSFQGGLRMSTGAKSKSEQESEFEVEGSLSAQVNRLNQTAAKLGSNYFGVTLTREDGIIVERDDHASELTINSDVLLDWRVAGIRKLYYDEVDDAIKFNGTLEAADGIFSGTLQGGTIEIGSGDSVFKADPNGIYLGAAIFANAPFKVDLSGVLTATGANISGSITMTGGSISWENVNTDPVATDAFNTAGTANTNALTAQALAAAIADGTYTGGTFIDGTTVAAPTIIGGEIIGGSITSNSTINVTTDIILGDSIRLEGSGPYQTIVLNSLGDITFDNTTATISIAAFNGVKIDGMFVKNEIENLQIDVSSLETRMLTAESDINNLESDVSGKIDAGTGGTKTIEKINATATGLVVWFTDNTNETILFD